MTAGPEVAQAPAATGRRYAGQSPDARAAQRRTRLLDAARQLIGAEGYAAFTVDALCALAGVSTRHFYQRYATKEAVFVDLYESMTRTAYQAVLASWRRHTGRPVVERIPAALRAYLAPMFADLATARIAFVEVVGVSPTLERTRLEYRDALVAFIAAETRQAAARGEIADRDFRFAALALIGAANVIVYDWAIRPDRPPAATVEQQLADLAVTLLAGPDISR